MKPIRAWRVAPPGIALLLVTFAIPWSLPLLSPSTLAQEERAADKASEERILELILALEREIEILLEKLPPGRRQAVLQKLQEQRQAKSPDLAQPGSRSSQTPSVDGEVASTSEKASRVEGGTVSQGEDGSARDVRAPDAAAPDMTAPDVTAPDVTAAGVTAAGRPTVDVEKTAQMDSNAPEAPTPTRRGCQTLRVLDTDGDGKISGLDRYWRHIYLWTDLNGDGLVSDNEFGDPYEKGIREIAAHLRTFVRGKGKKARSHEILNDGLLILDVAGDGWSAALPRRDDGALALDSDAVAKMGGPRLLGADGKPLTGRVPFRSGQSLELADGTVVELDCP